MRVASTLRAALNRRASCVRDRVNGYIDTQMMDDLLKLYYSFEGGK